MKNHFLSFLLGICVLSLLISRCKQPCPDPESRTSVNIVDSWDQLGSSTKDSLRDSLILKLISEKVSKNFLDSLRVAAAITYTDAEAWTWNYFDQLDDLIAMTEAKSVHFKLNELMAFLGEYGNNETLCTGTKGIRIYFSKYPSNYGVTKYIRKHHVILRYTCDGKDIEHSTTMPNTAYNFGDVCPPMCNLVANECYKNGQYRPGTDEDPSPKIVQVNCPN